MRAEKIIVPDTGATLAADRGRVRDITIIGAGPIGLTASFWAGMRRASCRILEALPAIGGQLTALYPDKWIYDVPGYPKIKARELVDRLAEQSLGQFDIPVHLSATARSLSRRWHAEHGEELVSVETDAGVFLSRTVLVAAGHGAFTPRPLPGIDTTPWEGRGLTFFVTEKERFAGRRVMIVGGGDSACDWAMELKDVAHEVVLVHRRDSFRAHQHTVELIKEAVSDGRIRLEVPCVVKEVGGDEALRHVLLAPAAKGGAARRVEIDDLIVQLGFITGLGPLADWGFEIKDGGVVVDARLGTSLPGVFACGDIATHASKIKLIATGFGEAATAVSHAMASIRPDTELQPEHSTSAGVPGAEDRSQAMSAA